MTEYMAGFLLCAFLGAWLVVDEEEPVIAMIAVFGLSFFWPITFLMVAIYEITKRIKRKVG